MIELSPHILKLKQKKINMLVKLSYADKSKLLKNPSLKKTSLLFCNSKYENVDGFWSNGSREYDGRQVPKIDLTQKSDPMLRDHFKQTWDYQRFFLLIYFISFFIEKLSTCCFSRHCIFLH